MANTTKAMIIDAIDTTIELSCSSGHVGQLTLCSISSRTSLNEFINLRIVSVCFARVVGVEPTAYGFGDRHSTN